MPGSICLAILRFANPPPLFWQFPDHAHDGAYPRCFGYLRSSLRYLRSDMSSIEVVVYAIVGYNQETKYVCSGKNQISSREG